MSFTDEYLELRKKRKQEEKEIISSPSVARGVAPLYVNKTAPLYINTKDNIAPVTTTKKKKEEEERTWFTKGAFEDGYDAGDISMTILGTVTDIVEEAGAGILGMGEKIVDAGAYVAGGVGKMFGADDFAEDTKEFIKKDLYDERKVAQSILSDGRADEFSVLGEKSDSLVQSGGQLVATVGLQAAGVPWFVTSGLTSFGGEVESAFNEDATYGEAGLSAAITAGAEILTEKISGGISFGGKTVDDVVTKRIARGVSNKVVRTLSKLGLDMAGEGTEEVLSGVMSAIGQKITYADDKELTELFTKEEALESFIGGSVLGGGMGGINAVKSGVKGVDYASGLTANEQKVVDKVYKDRVAEAEKNGKVSGKEKSKIYDEILKEMDKGGISTDTIEEVLGGDTYKNYQSAVKEEEDIRKVFDSLNQMKQGEMTGEQLDMRNELKQQLEEIKNADKQNQLKSQLGEEVFSLVQNDRLIESYNERGRKSQAFEADVTKYDTKQQATIQKAVDSGILNNTRRTREFVDMVAKISADKGVLFDFANNQKLKDSGFAMDGKTVNGFVTKDGVTLNIDAAKSLNSVVGHEITHVLEGTEVYTELQNILKTYADSKGEYQSRYDALTKLYDGVEGANIDAELTADLVGDYLFTDEDFIHNLSTKHRNVFQKIYDEVKYLCKVATAGSKEARELEKVRRAFEKAYKDDGKSSDGKQLSEEQQDVKVMDGGSVTKYSLSTWTPETQTKVRDNLVKAGYESDRVDKWIRDTNSVASVIAADRDRLDFEAADNQTMLKNNQEYVKTLDASTLCAKRLVYQGTFDAIQHRMPNTVLSSDDLIELANMMKRHGVEAPCAVCYVESRRRHLGKFAQEWLDGYNGEYKPNLDEVTTSDGLEALRKSHPVAYEDFMTAMKKKGSANPKVVELRTEYRNEIMSLTPAQVRKIEAIGGLRVQSFSDFETPHLLDMMQAVMDMSAKGLTSQAYTKVPNFAWVFGDTGIKINLSLIADGNGFDSDGNLAFSSIEGMDIDEAMRLRDAYSQNVGTIIVGANDKHILACMADDRIDYIIPFHRSGWGQREIEMMGMSSYDDYTYGQNEHDLNKPTKVVAGVQQYAGVGGNLYPPDYWDYNLSGKENAERYLNLCAKTGREPKFSKFLVNNGDGSYSLQPDGSTDGYWKTLIDFKMYDNEGNGAAQQKVQPNFNIEEAYRVLEEYEGGANKLPVANDVVEEFVAKHKSGTLHNNAEVLAPAMSLSDGEAPVYGKYNVFGKDIALTQEETQVESEENLTSAPVSEVVSAENATTTIEHSVSDLADIAKQGRRENMRGAYTHNGKQYLSDGSFIAEFNTVDESLEQSNDFPIKQAVKELDEAFARKVDGNYDLHTSDAKGFVKVGNSLFGTKRVNAIIRALENPVFSLANVRGGHEALVVTGDNGRAVLMPVRASGNAYLVYEAQPIAESATFPDDLAPMPEDAGRFESITDADAPPEMEAPYYGESDNALEAEDPFEERDWYEVSNRKVKAYMYDHPEVKPFFQEEAAIMLDELHNTVKGEKWYDDKVYYESGGEAGWGGTKRHTSESIARMLDEWHMSYADIEKGLNAIIEDHGAENIAAAKKIEFMLNERLLEGYKSFVGYEPNMDKFGRVPQNQDYINMLAESQIVDAYSKESFDALMADADRYAPPISEEIAPVAMKRDGNPTLTEKKEAYEAIGPKPQKEPRMAKATPAEQARASVLTEEPKVEKKKSNLLSMIKNNVLDKGMIFEDLSLATGNRELQARWNSIRYAESKAQRFMENNLKPIIETVENSGKKAKFYEYLYQMHNADRMTLAERFEDVPNKPVFGDGVTAEMSRDAASRLEKENPEFKRWAQEVYNYNRQNRELLVDGGVISREVANLWEEMYPHYVPIRRVGDEGLNINVPLDTGRTGVNAPIKRATGGNRDILPLFDTMGQRTMQTYKAIAKNRFGVELKNTLGTTVENEAFLLDEVIDGIDTHEELLQEGKNGKKPTFTVFENGEKVTFEITDEMYDAMKPKSKGMAYTSKALNVANNIRRGLLTEYNPTFLFTNAIKDTQDVVMNSQHPAKTYANYPKAVAELISKKGHWYQEYMDNGGEQNTYFESDTNTFAKEKSAIRKIVGFPLDKISEANNFIERVPRLAEYIASRKDGASVDVAMLDAARVTTNFAAGGDLTKLLNRNGVTFLNASVQGAMQQVRNVREAKANGLKGAMTLAAKLAAAGLPALLLNHLLWDDDEEYAELSDYVKQNYYIVGKYGDGKFVRIPKGRALAVIQNGFEQMENLITGNDEVDLATFGELLINNLAPNNPLDNNIIAPIGQALGNRTWYGEDLVPTRLQDLPAAEQYDETTDSISRWLGEKLDVSPYKINYLLDQYSGGVGDTFLPMLTPEAERGDNTLIAPLSDKFTTDSVMKNQNVSDFYTTKDELTTNANGSRATDEDILKSKYMNSVSSELSELYAMKREVQNSDMPDAEKYEEVRAIQQQINDLAKDSLNSYENVTIDGVYAKVGDVQFRWYEPGEDSTAEPGWKKLTDDQLEKQDEVTSGLGIDAAEYWSNKGEYDFAYDYPEKYEFFKDNGISYETYKNADEDGKRAYTWAYENPGKYTMSKAISDDFMEYYGIKDKMNDFDAKDANGETVSGLKKERVTAYIEGLDLDYGQKLILHRSMYKGKEDKRLYNRAIVEYLDSREDISWEDMKTILLELDFEVSDDGTISW